MDFPEILDNFLVAFAGIGAGGYAVWRRLRSDNTSDRLDNKSQRFIDNLQSQLEAERAENRSMGVVIDRISTERNEAVKEVGKLEGAVTALQGEVDRLSRHVTLLETENQRLTGQIEGMRSDINALTLAIANLAGRPQ